MGSAKRWDKNMMKWLVLMIPFFLLSCSSYRTTVNKEWEKDVCNVPIDLQSIEGQYSNISQKSNSLLWRLFHIDSKDNLSLPEHIIEIQVIDKNSISILLKDDNKILAKKVVDYNIEDEHLSLRAMRSFLKPAFPIYWWYTKEKLLLCITNENKLNILRHPSATIFIGPMPIFGGGGGPGMEYEYPKL